MSVNAKSISVGRKRAKPRIWRHVVGIVCVLLTIRDPYAASELVIPRVTGIRRDANGRKVLEVTANNYRDATRLTQGSTVEGSVSQVHTHVGPKKWEVRVEDWNT